MFRSPVPASKDQAYFRRTASRTKDVNIGVRIMRGGIRF